MRDKVRDPVFWSDVTQLVKTVVAVTLAWVLAVELVGTPQSFLAPWAALLVVHATVFRTFSQGARQVAAAVAGVLLAWSAGTLIGPDVAALAAVVFLGLLLGGSRWLEGEATTAAATGAGGAHDRVLRRPAPAGRPAPRHRDRDRGRPDRERRRVAAVAPP